MATALREHEMTAYDLSGRLSIREREVAEHLQHLSRSFARGPERLVVLPARCVKCGFVFAERERFAKPGRCPTCKSERIEPPRFAIQPSK